MRFWSSLGLDARWEQQGGTELVVERAEGLRPEEIIKAQAGMLERRDIQGLIPLRLEMVDERISFRYRMDGLRPLTRALSGPPHQDRTWEEVLLSIAVSVQEAGRYLIREHELVLDPEWIWTTENLRQVRLMALPLKSCMSPTSCWEQWKALYEALCRHALPSEWQERLRPQQWEPSTFSHRLWIHALQSAPSERMEEMHQMTDVMEEEMEAEPGISVSSITANTAPIQYADDGETMRFQTRNLSKDDWIRLLLAVVCWIGFALFPVLATLILACLGSLPLSVKLWQRYRLEQSGQDIESSVEAKPQPPPIEGPLADRTVLLRSPDATEVLSEADARAFFMQRRAWLEVTFEEEQRKEMVELAKDPFLIGRGPENVHIAVDHPAVSRQHAEIHWANGTYQVKDLGSLNGTVLNEVVMTPHELYPLESGSILRVPGITVVFRMERESMISKE